MRVLILRLLVAITTCAIGIAAGSIRAGFHNSPAKADPCRDDALIVMDYQPDAPIEIAILSASCAADFVNIDYKVVSKTDQLIKRYEVHISKGRHGNVDYDSYSSSIVNTSGPGMTASDLEHQSSGVSQTLSRGWFREPADEVRFTVWAVTFADGTEWHRSAVVD